MATLHDVYVVLREIRRQVEKMVLVKKSTLGGRTDKDTLKQLNKRGKQIMKLIPQELGISDKAYEKLPGTTEIGPRLEEELCFLKKLFDIP